MKKQKNIAEKNEKNAAPHGNQIMFLMREKFMPCQALELEVKQDFLEHLRSL